MNNEDTIEDWRFNINRANEIVRLYGNQTGFFVKITLSLIATYNILYVIFSILLSFILLNFWGFILLTIAFLAYLTSAVITLILSTQSHNTQEIEPAFCHYKYIFDKKGNLIEDNLNKIRTNLSSNDFREDYRKQLINLLKFQQNYYKIARNAKRWMIISVIIFVIGLGVFTTNIILLHISLLNNQ